MAFGPILRRLPADCLPPALGLTAGKQSAPVVNGAPRLACCWDWECLRVCLSLFACIRIPSLLTGAGKSAGEVEVGGESRMGWEGATRGEDGEIGPREGWDQTRSNY